MHAAMQCYDEICSSNILIDVVSINKYVENICHLPIKFMIYNYCQWQLKAPFGLMADTGNGKLKVIFMQRFGDDIK